MSEEFTPPPTPREITMYRRAMKERDFPEKMLYGGIFTRLPEREFCTLRTREQKQSRGMPREKINRWQFPTPSYHLSVSLCLRDSLHK